MNTTPIEWTDFTVNPVIARDKLSGGVRVRMDSGVGHYCEKVSAGCTNCYSSSMQRRFGMPQFGAGQHRGDVEILLNTEGLDKLAQRKKPARVFVGSMTDLFGNWVPDEMIVEVWKRLALIPQHTFQILTKRPERMAEFTRSWRENRGRDGRVPNIWCGVSIEDQSSADARRAAFHKVDVPVKFVSYEPALGPVDFAGWEFVQWIISGGESGKDARPSHPDWHRAARDFCKEFGGLAIPYLFKQWGEWVPLHALTFEPSGAHQQLLDHAGLDVYGLPGLIDSRCTSVFKVGKKNAGRLLDGRTRDEFPA